MTANQISELVKEFLNSYGNQFFTRETEIDVCLDAINHGKRWLQKKYDWTFLHNQQLVTIPLDGLDTTLPANGAFKRLTNIFSVNDDGSLGESMDWIDQAQVRKDFKDITLAKGIVYTIGKKLYVSAATIPTPLYLIGYQLLPDYTPSLQEDFFTEYAADFLKLFALKQLQMFVKEDARYYISKATLEDELTALEPWNSNISIGEDSLSLD